MRLVTFIHNGTARAGALTADGRRVCDLHACDARPPSDMLALLEGGADMLRLAAEVASAAPAAHIYDLAAVTLKAPVPRPGKIICIGQNYLEHAKESNAGAAPFPIIFAKYANTIIGHGETIVIPAAVQKPDYEGELAAVIGRRARNVAEADALAYVAGYMALNDVSARDWQNRTSQWVMGKTADTFCPIGPALVTADEVPNPQDLRVRTLIRSAGASGDEVMQDGYTGDMIFTVAFLIADMTRVMTLEPGDIIATGTPSGVGMARTPPRWLRPGDVVRVEIPGVGTLENPVILESR